MSLHKSILDMQKHHSDTMIPLVDIKTEECESTPINDKPMFIKAIENGNIELVESFINDPMFHIHSSNAALAVAVKHKNYEIVKLLLEDNRINPCSGENRVLVDTVLNECDSITQLLLTCQRINPSVSRNIVLMNAIRKGYKETIDLCLKHVRLNLCTIDYLDMCDIFNHCDKLTIKRIITHKTFVEYVQKQTRYSFGNFKSMFCVLYTYLVENKYNIGEIYDIYDNSKMSISMEIYKDEFEDFGCFTQFIFF